MKNPTTIFLTATVLVALSAAAGAAPEDATGRHDIGRLLGLADEWFDLETQDAVVLLDSLRVERLADGAVQRTAHTIVWFGTEIGLETYADVHVPWNADSGAVEVHDLRTWRDERWWPAADSVSGTAVVETTPGAVYRAYDYAQLREQALLHDGVELPCVVETRYTVVEERDPSLGLDGARVAGTLDPTVRNAFVLRLPGGEEAAFRALRGAPAPAPTEEGYVWGMTRLDRFERPLAGDRATTSPTLVWSSWPSWNAMAESFMTPFEEAAALEGAPLDSLAERLEGRHGAEARARATAAYLDEATRHVGADDEAWLFGPRPAQRTWETTYGHVIDRAALACALLRAAGLEAEAVWVGHRGTDLTDMPPGLERFERLLVEVRGAGFHGTLDPASSRLVPGDAAMAERTSWRPAAGGAPVHLPASAGTLEATMRLEETDDGAFAGRGYVLGTGWLAPYDRVTGLDGALERYAGTVARSVLSDAKAESPGVTVLESGRVELGCDVTLGTPDEDELGRLPFVIGDPAGGIVSAFEPSLELEVPSRDTPVRLPAAATERVTLELRVGERELVRAPEPVEIANDAGRFSLTVAHDGAWLVVTRELVVEAETGPDLWPELRRLLLEWDAPRNRTILLD